jgi:hypothetical protein
VSDQSIKVMVVSTALIVILRFDENPTVRLWARGAITQSVKIKLPQDNYSTVAYVVMSKIASLTI